MPRERRRRAAVLRVAPLLGRLLRARLARGLGLARAEALGVHGVHLVALAAVLDRAVARVLDVVARAGRELRRSAVLAADLDERLVGGREVVAARALDQHCGGGDEDDDAEEDGPGQKPRHCLVHRPGGATTIGSPTRTRPGATTSHHTPNVTSSLPRRSASALSTGASRWPSSGERVVTAQRSVGAATRSTASPARTSRPAQPCSSHAGTPSISIVMRKRRPSRPPSPSAAPSACSEARDISVTGLSSPPVSSSSRTTSATGWPACSDSASLNGPSTRWPATRRPS